MAVDATHQTVSALEVSKIFPLKKKRGGEGKGKPPKFQFGTDQPLCPIPSQTDGAGHRLSCCH